MMWHYDENKNHMMFFNWYRLNILIFYCVHCCTIGCVQDRDFDVPKDDCAMELKANASYAIIKSLYTEGTIQIYDDLVIEGYVISSDKAGNIFGSLHFQDDPIHPTEGFEIELDARNSHLWFPIGSKILIKLKGLYLGKQKGVYKLGGVFTSFGNESIGRLPVSVIDRHIFMSCTKLEAIHPSIIAMDEIPDNPGNTLVQFDNVEFSIDEVDKPFAENGLETKRTLVDCNDNELVLLNSGYADFQTKLIPDGRGSITGILKKGKDEYQLVLRNLDDIVFKDERCADLIDEFTSNRIFISELADPDNNAKARFVELYNAATQPLSLKGWSLRRYTNANSEIGSIIDLSGFMVNGESALVLSPNASEFEKVYGFAPDLEVGGNSPANSNGDDNLELVDPFGTLIDRFGIPGEDGSGTDHEFEDGRALRKPEISMANRNYIAEEWVIYNDTGSSGTINEPKSAPEDYSPGTRN